MPSSTRGQGRPNLFYVLLLVVSTLFAVTSFAYLIGPSAVERSRSVAGAARPAPSLAMTDWLDRRGPTLLGIEFAVMLVLGVTAMATDHLFSGKPREHAGDKLSP